MTKEELLFNIKSSGISCDKNQIDLLEKYLSYTLETNEKFNLTAIKDPLEFREKMIFDSVLPLKYIEISNKSIIDIGTGAGYPGMVLSLLSPLKVSMLDSTKKKIDFINSFIKENSLSSIAICDRAENYARNHRGQFDYAIARAVSALNVLIELTMPLLKVGGFFIAMKGPNALEEIKDSKKTMDKLFCSIEKIHEEELPFSKEKRTIIIIKKNKETPNKYPRDYSEIVNHPLR